MIQKCGVDYNCDGRPHCGKTFDDAECWTLCPHPAIDDLSGLMKIKRWERRHIQRKHHASARPISRVHKSTMSRRQRKERA